MGDSAVQRNAHHSTQLIFRPRILQGLNLVHTLVSRVSISGKHHVWE